MQSLINKSNYLAYISLVGVFIVDILTPTEFVVDILYLCCILLVFRQNSETIVRFSAATCLLIIADTFLVHYQSKANLSLLVNRGMAIFAILLTSYIAIHYRKISQASKQREIQYLTALEKMLFITSHHVRKPIANIIGLAEIMDTGRSALSEHDLKVYFRYLNSSANELDNIVKELNAFIEQTERQNHVPYLINQHV